MSPHEPYMHRCLQLARLGLGNVQPNPMVGAVIVHNDRIIGEGYHRKYGEAHAEINALRSVKEPELLKESTIYVNLEPCSHFGKTPPCADKLIETGIPRVVIGTCDPHDKVNGKGVAKLRDAGINVITNVLAEECEKLNCRFFTYHKKQRPYIILKWAQTADGYMDIVRHSPSDSYWITNQELRVIAHKWRSEEQAILIGYNTYANDHPQLTTRYYPGNNPRKYLMLDKNRSKNPPTPPDFNLISNDLEEAMHALYEDKIQSVIVEGGRKTLDMFIQSGLWDEARILVGNQQWGEGTPAPIISQHADKTLEINHNEIHWVHNR